MVRLVEPMFEYRFPAIRGIQAGREYYVSQCPLRLLPRLFTFDDTELPVEVRAQRTLNRQRLPEMASYVVENRKDYVFSAITASVDGELHFEPFGEPDSQLGLLQIPMSARFIINDGQHRRGAIELALAEDPSLGDETIAVVFFTDLGLERCQQMFADLNRYAIRPSASIGVLYDHLDPLSSITREAVARVALLRDVVELEKTTLAPKSRKLFTLSAQFTANKALLAGREPSPESIDLVVVSTFKFDDFIAFGDAERQTDGAHNSLSTAVDKTDHIDIAVVIEYQFPDLIVERSRCSE